MQLKHPNVVQCLGAVAGSLHIALDWMQNGEVMYYLRKNPDASRVHLVGFLVFTSEEPCHSTLHKNFRY